MNMHVNSVLLVVAFFCFGCAGDPGKTPVSPDAGVGDIDAGGDVNVDVDSVDACVPATVCEDVCGDVDDGCGGVLSCAACECVDGLPSEPNCGPCALGVSVCGDGGEVECVLPDGVSSNDSCESIIFVRSGEAGDGSKDSPLGSLGEAIALVDDERSLILVSGDFSEPVLLSTPVRLAGGFNTNWMVDGRSALIGAEVDGAVYGIRVVGSDDADEFGIYNWDISTPDASESLTNYGVYQRDASLRLENVSINTGNGGVGDAGPNGENGTAGVDGSDPSNPVVGTIPSSTPAVVNPDCGVPGGYGGAGAWLNQGTGLRERSEDGETVGLALGGRGGVASAGQGAQTVSDGGDGVFGTNGSNGLGGSSGGSVADGFWEQAGKGGDGPDGGHGSGGAGGGGADLFAAILAPVVLNGVPGAGGGSGGCGGKGGVGGQPGGASFGVFAYNSVLRVANSEIVSGFGGMGGLGGTGGFGGLGGNGGKGSSRSCYLDTSGTLQCENSTEFLVYRNSGDGGDGGGGGRGGSGGGGAGGVSIGAFCFGTSFETDDMSIFDSKGQALGGEGGAGASAGSAGLSSRREGCQ